MSVLQQVPIVVLKEGTMEIKVKDAQRNNITDAKLVAELVRYRLLISIMTRMEIESLYG